MKPETQKRQQAGFTLYELLITSAVVGVIVAYGAPNLVDFMANSRMTAAANDLHSAFFLARSEAARAKTNVSICGSTNPMAEDPDCDGQFEDGWIVFEDPDGWVTHEAGEAILRRHEALPPKIKVSSPGMMHYFSYSADGLGRGNVNGFPPLTIALLCDDRGNSVAAGGLSAARALVITPLGRATVLRDRERVQFAIDRSGASCP